MLGLTSKNERTLRRIGEIVQAIGGREASYKGKTDAELRLSTERLRSRIRNGETLDEVLVDSFALVREASSRGNPGMRHYDVQLVGAIALHEGMIAQMATGEGKTLAATCPAFLNALSGHGVHVVTPNSYLAKRDAEWMGPIYERLGLSVGCVHSGDLKRQYDADITYGTNDVFAFDYLRDNLKIKVEDLVQRPLNYVIIDEVDSILIDKARNPTTISGATDTAMLDQCRRADDIVRMLRKGEHFDSSTGMHLTDKGVELVQRLLQIESLFDSDHMGWVHFITQALRAHYDYRAGRDYIIKDGEVVIVDTFTGRLSEGSRWSDGLHEALEAKEKLAIQPGGRTIASITIQHFFQLYNKIAGMTGTAETESREFQDVYGLPVVVVPTHREMIRIDEPDQVYATAQDKYLAIVQQVKRQHATGRPVLIGTTSIEKSHIMSSLLERSNVRHESLTANQHEREALIIKNAGQKYAVTIAGNMAGRGVDIELGEGVAEIGGLLVIGTERHEARRMDDQLRGRAGRQGDPGSSCFYLSLEDDLLQQFMPPWMINLMARMGFQDGMNLEDKRLTKGIERAQKKIEERNSWFRRNLMEWDGPLNYQRQRFYEERTGVLRGHRVPALIWRLIMQHVERVVQHRLSPSYLTETVAERCGRMGLSINPDELDRLDVSAVEDAVRETALSVACDDIRSKVSQYVAPGVPRELWDTQGLAEWGADAFGAQLLDENIDFMECHEIEQRLIESAASYCEHMNLEWIKVIFEDGYSQQQLVSWARGRFGIEVDEAEINPDDPLQASELLLARIREAYRLREADYPIAYITEIAHGVGSQSSRDAAKLLASWMKLKFGYSWAPEEIPGAIDKFLVELRGLSRAFVIDGKLEQELDQACSDHPGESFLPWVERRFSFREPDEPCLEMLARSYRKITYSYDAAEVSDGATPRNQALGFARHVLRYELTLLEQYIALRIFDQAWQDHLFEMEHLRSSLKQRPNTVHPLGQFAIQSQALFRNMWGRIAEHVTDRVFRVGVMNDDEIHAKAEKLKAVMCQAEGPSGDESHPYEQPEARASSPSVARPESAEAGDTAPGKRLNDPCPCGSGRKHSRCCGAE